ncbi:MAG: hypothetical protein ACQEV6_13890 [Pseudomonadota bacterium]
MKPGAIRALSLAVALAVPAGAALAQQDQSQNQMRSQMTERDQSRMRDQDGHPMAGYQLMTPEEREQYRDRMGSMNSAGDRQAYREQHHQRMVERARAQGLDADAVGDLPATAAGEQRREMRNGKGMGPGQPGMNRGTGSDEGPGPDINRQRSGDGMPRANPPGGVHQ